MTVDEKSFGMGFKFRRTLSDNLKQHEGISLIQETY